MLYDRLFDKSEFIGVQAYGPSAGESNRPYAGEADYGFAARIPHPALRATLSPGDGIADTPGRPPDCIEQHRNDQLSILIMCGANENPPVRMHRG